MVCLSPASREVYIGRAGTQAPIRSAKLNSSNVSLQFGSGLCAVKSFMWALGGTLGRNNFWQACATSKP